MFRPLVSLAAGLAALPGGRFLPDPRFAGASAGGAAQDRTSAAAEPPADAWHQGHAAGRGEAEALARAHAEHTAAALGAIGLSFARLDREQAAALADRLRETVIALCSAAIEAATIDPDSLARRIAAAVALLQRAADDRVVRLHPDDLALVADRLPADLATSADASLERGTVRVETAAGGVEDGPASWRAAIAAAVQEC